MDATANTTAMEISDLVREKMLSAHNFLPTAVLGRLANTCFKVIEDGIRENVNVMNEAKSRSNLMLLPAEIRNRIFDLVLAPEHFTTEVHVGKCNNVLHRACEPYLDLITSTSYVELEALEWQSLHTKAEDDDEIRIQYLYNEYDLHPAEMHDPRNQSPNRTRLPAITQVSRQVRDEATSMYYGAKTFTAYWYTSWYVESYAPVLVCAWLNAIGHENRAKIRHLELRYVNVLDDLCYSRWISENYRTMENVGRATKWLLHQLFPDLKQQSVQIVFCWDRDTGISAITPLDWKHPEMPYKLKLDIWRKLGDHGFPKHFITDGSPNASALRESGRDEIMWRAWRGRWM